MAAVVVKAVLWSRNSLISVLFSPWLIALARGSSQRAAFCLSIYWNVGRIKITGSAITLLRQSGEHKQTERQRKPTQTDKWGHRGRDRGKHVAQRSRRAVSQTEAMQHAFVKTIHFLYTCYCREPVSSRGSIQFSASSFKPMVPKRLLPRPLRKPGKFYCPETSR